MIAEPGPRRVPWGYATMSAILGGGWYVVLLVPALTRDFLKSGPVQNLICLALASLLVAVTLRRFILSADSFAGHLRRAVLLPYLGSLVYFSLWTAWWWLEHLLVGNLANLHDTLSLFALGLTAAAVSFWVVIPYGLACQYALHYLWRLEPHGEAQA